MHPGVNGFTSNGVLPIVSGISFIPTLKFSPKRVFLVYLDDKAESVSLCSICKSSPKSPFCPIKLIKNCVVGNALPIPPNEPIADDG